MLDSYPFICRNKLVCDNGSLIRLSGSPDRIPARLVYEAPVGKSGTLAESILGDTKQVWEPKSSTKRLPDGTLVSPPLEDLAPFLPREELERRRTEQEAKGKDAWTPLHRDRQVSRALRFYASAVSSADKGAVRLI